ncbi:MAG: glycosyl transferase family 1 [Microcystis viridis Mv_BB_P_19951000_S69]|jgi:MGT family glycosyltransferase|uniref:Glycosyl transferase family 1 n=2 Tax=Microcystis TaxID=1125 RepID=A0A552I3F2_MICVR|nr:MAG: glycosyl transferase family 1 [Microcystis aeruginosa Ma_AC_P_19900807_S299]TRU28087.1 MAG: glycosyl transferase family 1 [Microcystis aeruginosa Ma_SC_T_19800800_S464]TRU69235.1 MAG: glycosyl transferase family 1 [Microcystis viridis Mv_BB_P_19951000_S69]TRU77811.1 MAG: glycosyl transferase family 1 [Microcystis viridis Mv_BB_P_19951000_S68]TRU78003.1 MAG: glycosyl transferase family 1 [Microcystis viridis Mv_BB_P_19951000_S68D]TRU79931.1 MAG: glycosyl transferase family 1 [Microcysti
MTHFGSICPAATGHLNTMNTLGRELQRRGHRVTVLGMPDAEANAKVAGLEFRAISPVDFPVGTTAKFYEDLGKLTGLAALRYTICLSEKTTASFLLNAPQVIKDAGIEALIIDECIYGGSTVADFLKIPFVTASSALVNGFDNTIPPAFTTWKYNPAWWARLRNRLGYGVISRFSQPIYKVISAYRQKYGMPACRNINDYYSVSKLAIISQQPAEFEYPRHDLNGILHFTGPHFDSTGRKTIDFPYEKLNDKPLIYTSMGTLQNRLTHIFYKIAEACVGLDAQLVIALGGGLETQALPNLPGNPIVVKYAPQLELLQKASLTICHSGTNTVLESLFYGVPIVAIPIANDQAGVATRIAWSGVGKFITPSSLTTDRLRRAIQEVLTQPSYQENALRLKTAIQKAGGVPRAVDIIEEVISNRLK